MRHIRLWRNGKSWTTAEIVAETGLSRVTVNYRLRHGEDPFADAVRYRREPPLVDSDTPFDEDLRCQYVVAKHPEGLSWHQIGRLMGVSQQRVQQVYRQAAAKLVAVGLSPGEDHPEWTYPEAAE